MDGAWPVVDFDVDTDAELVAWAKWLGCEQHITRVTGISPYVQAKVHGCRWSVTGPRPSVPNPTDATASAVTAAIEAAS
jgi:hypothetical protein